MTLGGLIRLPSGGRALRHRNYRLFFFGQIVSLIGTWMQSTAQGWLVFTLVGPEKSPAFLGLLGVVQFLPVLVLGLFGGMIADLWPKRRTVIVTQTASALLALVLAALVFTGTVQVWHVLVLGFLLGTVNAVDMPTRQSFVVEMVGREDVVNAVGLNSAVFNSARIFGPSFAGMLIAVFGTAVCFLLNGLSFLAVIAGLLLMRDEELRPSERLAMPKSAREIRENLAEGVMYVWKTPAVLLAVSVVGLVSTFGMNFNVILPSLAGAVLNVGPEGFGFLQTAMGVGALLAALTVASLPRPMIRVLIGGAVITSVSEIVLAGTRVYPVAILMLFVVGIGVIAMSATANSLVQITVPGPLRGRVMSVYTTVFAGSTPVGNGFTGAIGTAFGIPAEIFSNGLLSGIVSVAAAVAVIQGRVPDVGRGRRTARVTAADAATQPQESAITPAK